jgi:hypothetical protein
LHEFLSRCDFVRYADMQKFCLLKSFSCTAVCGLIKVSGFAPLLSISSCKFALAVPCSLVFGRHITRMCSDTHYGFPGALSTAQPSSKKMTQRLIVWFRNDLRVTDNYVLAEATKRLVSNRYFCFSIQFLCMASFCSTRCQGRAFDKCVNVV